MIVNTLCLMTSHCNTHCACLLRMWGQRAVTHSLTSLLAASSSSSSSSSTVNLIISGSRLHRAERLSATAPLRLATELCSVSASGMIKGPE